VDETSREFLREVLEALMVWPLRLLQAEASLYSLLAGVVHRSGRSADGMDLCADVWVAPAGFLALCRERAAARK
jgi:hypothetical protein